jgi:hypothetical protein
MKVLMFALFIIGWSAAPLIGGELPSGVNPKGMTWTFDVSEVEKAVVAQNGPFDAKSIQFETDGCEVESALVDGKKMERIGDRWVTTDGDVVAKDSLITANFRNKASCSVKMTGYVALTSTRDAGDKKKPKSKPAKKPKYDENFDDDDEDDDTWSMNDKDVYRVFPDRVKKGGTNINMDGTHVAAVTDSGNNTTINFQNNNYKGTNTITNHQEARVNVEQGNKTKVVKEYVDRPVDRPIYVDRPVYYERPPVVQYFYWQQPVVWGTVCYPVAPQRRCFFR